MLTMPTLSAWQRSISETCRTTSTIACASGPPSRGAVEIEWVTLERAHAFQVTALFWSARSAGLSLGDRACLALAVQRDLPVMTADRVWAGLGLPIDIQLIR